MKTKLTMNNLTAEEKELFDFCIKMGDSEELAYEAVLIERKKKESFDSYYLYNHAYFN